jgi:hypothetical protein
MTNATWDASRARGAFFSPSRFPILPPPATQYVSTGSGGARAGGAERGAPDGGRDAERVRRLVRHRARDEEHGLRRERDGAEPGARVSALWRGGRGGARTGWQQLQDTVSADTAGTAWRTHARRAPTTTTPTRPALRAAVSTAPPFPSPLHRPRTHRRRRARAGRGRRGSGTRGPRAGATPCAGRTRCRKQARRAR